ncbi:unnamed protein product [Didymodactylos carnosus]|uniref:Uncharacterized protein n=1 Tax=Didymodactylos carnosus TaxID=1234261 RepID=A0A8S2SQ80_9BILA|nr:unnamed protein product [Didymodactylos carnosus]CAF4244338.1 unnamed protein product [Didymodactylos carnosus]
MSEVTAIEPTLNSSFSIEEPSMNKKSEALTPLQGENDKIKDTDNTIRPQTCFLCQESLRDRSPKLLACLHSVCENCLPSLREPLGSTYKCSICHYTNRSDMICDNLYLTNDEDSDNGQSQIEQTINDVPRVKRTCHNCEEGNISDWYCNNCHDWLCEECKNAHSRVRLTKDHIVIQKGFDQATRHDKLIYCSIHKQELIRFYCEDCNLLICHDCQLEQHTDHRYMFIDTAVHSQRKNLRSLMSKVRECRTMLDRCQIATAQRGQVIDTAEVINDIKVFGMHIISEVSNVCKELINDMNAICEKARIQCSEKQNRLDQFIQNVDHSLEFTDEAVNTGNKIALLSSIRSISNRLNDILNDSYRWSKSSNQFQLSFQFEPDRFRPVISKLGILFVNGKPVTKAHQQKPDLIIKNSREILNQTNHKEHKMINNDSTLDEHNQISDSENVDNSRMAIRRNDQHRMQSELPKIQTNYQNTSSNPTTYVDFHQSQEQTTNGQQDQKSSLIEQVEQQNTLVAEQQQQQQQVLDTSDGKD